MGRTKWGRTCLDEGGSRQSDRIIEKCTGNDLSRPDLPKINVVVAPRTCSLICVLDKRPFVASAALRVASSKVTKRLKC